MKKTGLSFLFVFLCTAFSLAIDTDFTTTQKLENSIQQSDSINRALLINKWWIPNHKMNSGRAAALFFDPYNLKMKLCAPLAWKWKGNENIIQTLGIHPCEYKVLKLTEDEFVFEYKDEIFYFFVK